MNETVSVVTGTTVQCDSCADRIDVKEILDLNENRSVDICPRCGLLLFVTALK